MSIKANRPSELTVQLPASLDEVLEVIGEAATLKMIDSYGGTTPRLPAKRNVNAKHPMTLIIGLEALEQLVKQLGGGRHVYIPRCAAGLRSKRDREIVQKYEAGTSVDQLAMQYRLSDRQIWSILKKTEMDDVQESLF